MRILIIEEDHFASTLLSTKLRESFNCYVDKVQHSQKGFRLLKTEKPYDFIVANCFSLTSLGYELMEFQRRHSIPGLFVFYTNSTNQDGNVMLQNAQIVPRINFESLRIFITRQYRI